MKTKTLSLRCYWTAASGVLLSFALFLCPSARSQNLLKNGDFEQPLGPTNWAVKYFHGGPDDFQIKDRSRDGSRRAAWYGGYFRPITAKLVHGYFSQTVTNLTPGHVYAFGGYMREGWWKAPDDALRDKFLVYIEAIGGQGNPTRDGRLGVIATNDLTDAAGNVDPNIDAPYTYPTIIWRPFFGSQTPDTNRQIEIRLHYDKVSWVEYDKLWTMEGAYDDVYLTP
jgi:hypothetical protein